MKAWMKALVWVGLGGGIGFFSGYRAGYAKHADDISPILDDLQARVESMMEVVENLGKDNDRAKSELERLLSTMPSEVIAEAAMDDYRGNPEPEPEEEPEMPMEEPVIDDLEEDPEEEDDPDEVIPDLHPEDMRPHPISEDEFNRNEKGYDISVLKYYAGDDLVYDPEYDEEMTQPEQLLGIGWFALFGGGHDTIYIENDTMETIYAVHYLEGSIGDT